MGVQCEYYRMGMLVSCLYVSCIVHHLMSSGCGTCLNITGKQDFSATLS